MLEARATITKVDKKAKVKMCIYKRRAARPKM